MPRSTPPVTGTHHSKTKSAQARKFAHTGSTQRTTSGDSVMWLKRYQLHFECLRTALRALVCAHTDILSHQLIVAHDAALVRIETSSILQESAHSRPRTGASGERRIIFWLLAQSFNSTIMCISALIVNLKDLRAARARITSIMQI